MTQVTRHLPDKYELTVITIVMNVSMELVPLQGAERPMLGGIVWGSSEFAVGPHTEEMIDGYMCDKLFLGVDGFDLDYGLTTANTLEARLNEAMIRAAQQPIIVADASKFGQRGLSCICGVDAVQGVITDRAVPGPIIEPVEERGIEVDVV